MDPLSKVDNSHITLQGFPSLAGCREELLDPPDLDSMTAVACSIFLGKAIRPLGFSRRGVFIGEGASSRGGTGGLTMGRCNIPSFYQILE
jgi:hypothetical protein